MEENTNTKITYTKNMNKFNFNTTLSIPIDANANIKTILDVNSFLYDQKVECVNGKAIVSGKIGVKVLYLDTDNISNTIFDNTSFSETYLDSSLTSDTYLNMYNSIVTNNVLSTDGNLKISCDVSITPVAYLNLALSNTITSQDCLITKKSEISTNTISQFINTKFEHTTNLETKESISKILCHNSYFTPEKVMAENGYAIVEGKLTSCVLFESNNGNDSHIHEIKETSNIKCDIEIEGITKENNLDISFILDKANNEISTELEDGNNVITIKNKICVCGVALKNISLELIDDLYSTENELETTLSHREYTKQANNFSVCETISNETNLNSNEPAIDEVVANLNITPEITNTYIKDGNLMLEGIVTSNLTYIDENKEFKHKQIEIPFIINSKLQMEQLGCIHSEVSVMDARIKVKRGTVIELEYTLFINLAIYEKDSHEMVDNFTIGKALDFSKYDFQIFLSKPNETLWELCKRIKISPEDIRKYNKDLPLIMEGGEKVIIKR